MRMSNRMWHLLVSFKRCILPQDLKPTYDFRLQLSFTNEKLGFTLAQVKNAKPIIVQQVGLNPPIACTGRGGRVRGRRVVPRVSAGRE